MNTQREKVTTISLLYRYININKYLNKNNNN